MTPATPIVTGNTERTMPENRAFYPALDGLRAVAFLLVFLQHYLLFPWGWTGVNVFFVLSGFLITGILFDSRGDSHRARNFYVRRMLRIFPLFYGVLIAFLVLDPIMHWHWSIGWLAWPLYLGNFLRFASSSVLVNNSHLQLAAFAWLRAGDNSQVTLYLGHFWSLCVEEQFYFLWPWVVFWTPRRRALIWICVSVVILVTVGRLVAQHAAPVWMIDADLLQCATPFQLDSLLLGGLVALLIRTPYERRVIEIGRVVALYCGLLAGFFLVAGIAISYPNWRAGYPYPSWKLTWGATIADFLSAGIILSALQPSGIIYRILNIRALRWVGRVSYGAYVFHDIFHGIYIRWVAVGTDHIPLVREHSEFFVALVGITSTLLLSWLSFRFYESAFLNLKERWTIRESKNPSIEV